MKTPIRMWMTGIALILPLLSLFVGCGDSDDEGDPIPLAEPTVEQQSTMASPESLEEVVITIGNLSDLTGTSARVIEVVNMALEDMVEHYNNLISGVKLKVITYDGQSDPAKDIPGYEWLKGKGADLIFAPVGGSSVTLKPRVDQDKIVLFTTSANPEDTLPPGYVFSLGIHPQYEAYTLLKWIAENDWGYRIKGPAKIGGAAWVHGYSQLFFDSMEEYAKAHPDQFEWVGGYLINISFTWVPEVEALKDCDYVNPCPLMSTFVREYHQAGGKAKIIGGDAQAAFMGMIDDGNQWEEIDRMLFIRQMEWWNDEGELVDLAKKFLYENHPDSAEDIIRQGAGYIGGVNMIYQMLDIIRQAVETVGPENFDSQALYNSAVSYSWVVEGIERASFSDTKRNSLDYFAIYEARSDDEDLFRVDSQWYPAVREP